MFQVNIDTTIDSLSSYRWNAASFINDDRNFNNISSTISSTGGTIPSVLSFSDNISDINFSNNYYCFLTDNISISSIFSSLTSVYSMDYGISGSQINMKYDTTLDNFSAISQNNNIINMMGIVTNGTNLNIVPLKNKYSTNGISYVNDTNHKNYQKIYNNNNIFLQFKIRDIPLIIKSDEPTTITHSYGISSTPLNDMDFVKFGAIGGNCPANSDIILFDTSEYSLSCEDHSYRFNFSNGTMLCAWLSSQTCAPASEKIWMERWYDPNTTSSQDAALININNNLSSFTHILDISSNKTIYNNENMLYIRYGPKRNENFINSLSSNSVMDISDWKSDIVSSVGSVSGFIVGDYGDAVTQEFILDGNVHVHIPPLDDLVVENNITVSMWVYSDDWKTCSDTQFFGNFYNGDGYGIYHNTNKQNSLITLPTVSGKCISLNSRGFKVFEKDMISDLGLSSMSINYVKNDIFDNKWLYDSYNHSIYKLENDDIINYIIDIPTDSSITKMECNSKNELFILDSFSNTISSFDSAGIFLSAQGIPAYYDNFEIDISDTIIYDNADFLLVDNENNIIKLVGSTLYNNNNRILHLTDKPTSIKIDIDNYIWILYERSLVKLDNTGKIAFNKKLDISIEDYSAEMGFVTSTHKGVDTVRLWIIFNSDKKLLVIDLLGNIIKRIDVNNILITNKCNTTEMNIVGDFTGFDNRRKFQQLNNKPISVQNPSVCLKIGMVCGGYKKYICINSHTNTLNGWAHFTFSVENDQDITTIKLYINGQLFGTEVLSGNYSIDYGSNTSPFIIGGASGKLGAKNLEKSITTNEFFIGKIDDIKIYSTVLDPFTILHLSLNNHFSHWSDMNYFVKISPITLIEEIDQFHINRYKGFKSNIFNIKIKNFTDDSALQSVMVQYILRIIGKIKPVNTVLNDIKFE